MSKFPVESMVINCDKLRLRERPSLEANVLALMPRDSKVTIISQYREWFKVSFDNIEGYCLKAYIASII